MKKLISIIIPTYNEEKVIAACLKSLQNQSYRPVEIIVVDDGSTDKTISIIENLEFRSENLKMLKQKHLGPGPARNLGAKSAKGEILVFIDADMTFDDNFIKDLTKPIMGGKTIGTFSKNEMNANWQNIWSACWNINRNWPIDRLIPPDYPDTAPVFRAILKSKFEEVGGFDATGEYTDDWSLSRKLALKSTLAKGALYYHSNPDNLKEVAKQASWIGKNEFISGSLIRKIRSLVFYSPPISLTIGIFKSATNQTYQFLVFKLIYDFAIWLSVIQTFFSNKKSK
jgi:glycosyltransferase involved in cell wall biosynthesis